MEQCMLVLLGAVGVFYISSVHWSQMTGQILKTASKFRDMCCFSSDVQITDPIRFSYAKYHKSVAQRYMLAEGVAHH